MSGFEAHLTPGPLHRLDGSLAESGWATSPVRAYERDRLKTPKRRIREWDRYLVHDDEFAVFHRKRHVLQGVHAYVARSVLFSDVFQSQITHGKITLLDRFVSK